MSAAMVRLLPAAPDERRVERETLDHLPVDDPRARHARRDLRVIHRMMGTHPLLRRALLHATADAPPRRVLEIGCGDGRLLLDLAPRLPWPPLQLTLLDRQDTVSPATLAAYQRCGWQATPLRADVCEALPRAAAGCDLVVACLFLHHFDDEALAPLLGSLAAHARAVVAFEPRRSSVSLLGSRLVGLLGANAVTREDAVLSVRAGFRDTELTTLWHTGAGDDGWLLHEATAGPFGHVFVARRCAMDQ
jgi:SAM-dependent methyltransferase